MRHERDIAESYRTRAEEIRMLAEMDQHAETREALERVAQDYERMAVSMDHIAQTNEAMRKVASSVQISGRIIDLGHAFIACRSSPT